MNAKLQFTFLFTHRPNHFILLCRKEILYEAWIYCRLKIYFPGRALPGGNIYLKKKKKLFQLHCRTRILVFLIVEFPVEALLWCVPSLFIGCIRTNCGTKYPLILTPQVSIIHVCFLPSFCSIFCVMMPAVKSVEVIGPWHHSSRRSQGQEVHPQCTATSS